MSYDQSRVWLLAVFSVAAHREIPSGAVWASKVGGFFGPFKRVEDLPMVGDRHRRPLYNAFEHERILLNSDMELNRIMTGLRHCINPHSVFGLLKPERDCIQSMLEFIQPTLLQSPKAAREEIEKLLRILLRDKELSIAA